VRRSRRFEVITGSSFDWHTAKREPAQTRVDIFTAGTTEDGLNPRQEGDHWEDTEI
jgi:hypothetical protein